MLTCSVLIVDTVLLEGFKDAADKFRSESSATSNIDLETMNDRIKVREAVQVGNIQGAIDLVNDLHPELLDCNRYLYFHLQVRMVVRAPQLNNIVFHKKMFLA